MDLKGIMGKGGCSSCWLDWRTAFFVYWYSSQHFFLVFICKETNENNEIKVLGPIVICQILYLLKLGFGGSYCSISEKAMAPRSSTLAWKIPWAEEPGRLQSMGSLRVGHDWATSLSLFTFMHWRRKWQPTPVFLPGESQGRGSLVGCRL